MPHPSETPVVVLAGGRGARFNHESEVVPKPLIEVLGRPMLEHIIEGFIDQGFREFIIPVGYLGELIISWAVRRAEYYGRAVRLRAILTGDDSHTGQRIWNVREQIAGRRFVLTYGDGLSDVRMADVIGQHERTGAGVTMTVVRPPGRFGVVRLSESQYVMDSLMPNDIPPTQVISFDEKPDVGWINGGFMVAEPQFIDRYIDGPDASQLERVALPELAADGGLHAFQHTGYWRCIDTRRDLELVEDELLHEIRGPYPWRRWMPVVQ